MNNYDIIILGSGPAGYTAALYTSRAFLKTLVMAGPEPGGQLTTTTDVDNFPGFPDGIKGSELIEAMKKQTERFGTEVVNETVTAITVIPAKPAPAQAGEPESKRETLDPRLRGDDTKRKNVMTPASFRVVDQGGKKHKSRAVIVATGASARRLNIPSEEKLWAKGISACATCDGFFFRGKEVVVIGGGDTAMEEALFLTTFASKVTIIHRRDQFRASAIMLDRARKNNKIAFLTHQTIEEFVGDQVLTGVKLKDTKTGEIVEYPTQGAFLAIGHTPATQFLQGVVELDAKGYIVLSRPVSSLEPQTATSVPGIFAAGDCVDPRYRQAVVAAGMGCMAALDVQRWLTE